MFRNIVWLLISLNVVIIATFSFYRQPLELTTTLQPELQLATYLLWLSLNVVVFIVLFAKADQVGEGAISFLGLSVQGTLALIIITALYIFLVNNPEVEKIFTVTYGTVLGLTTFGQFMTNLYCFEKRPAPT